MLLGISFPLGSPNQNHLQNWPSCCLNVERLPLSCQYVGSKFCITSFIWKYVEDRSGLSEDMAVFPEMLISMILSDAGPFAGTVIVCWILTSTSDTQPALFELASEMLQLLTKKSYRSLISDVGGFNYHCQKAWGGFYFFYCRALETKSEENLVVHFVSFLLALSSGILFSSCHLLYWICLTQWDIDKYEYFVVVF